MLVLVVVLLAVWLIVSIVGFAMKGLMWLGIVGVVLFPGTAVIGAIRRKTLRRPSSTPRTAEDHRSRWRQPEPRVPIFPRLSE